MGPNPESRPEPCLPAPIRNRQPNPEASWVADNRKEWERQADYQEMARRDIIRAFATDKRHDTPELASIRGQAYCPFNSNTTEAEIFSYNGPNPMHTVGVQAPGHDDELVFEAGERCPELGALPAGINMIIKGANGDWDGFRSSAIMLGGNLAPFALGPRTPVPPKPIPLGELVQPGYIDGGRTLGSWMSRRMAAAPSASGAAYSSYVSRAPGTLLDEFSAVKPGPLVEDLATTYSGARYGCVELSEPLTLHRAWHPGGAREFGAFWSFDAPGGSLQARIDSALLPKWGNEATQFTTIRVPAGTRIYVGEVSTQGGAWVGGGSQVLIEGGAQEGWKIGGGLLK